MDSMTVAAGITGMIFVGVVALAVLWAARGVLEWMTNNGEPVLSERARVVAKRSEARGRVFSDVGGRIATSYYATFEFPDGERLEFSVRGKAFGLLSEGDVGELTYQGSRYHGFERARGAVMRPGRTRRVGRTRPL